MKLPIRDILIDPSIQIRERLDEDTVQRYMETLDDLPPVVVFDDAAHILADGFHRCEAAIRLGRKEIDAEVREGGRAEAEEFAIVANTRHGRPLNRAERNEGIKRLLAHGWTQQRVADEMGVAQHTVSNIANSMALRGEITKSAGSGLASQRRAVKPLPPEIAAELDDTKLYRIAGLPADRQEEVARLAVERNLTEPRLREVVAQVNAGQPIRIPEPEVVGADVAVRRVIDEVSGFFDRTLRWNGKDVSYREVIRITIENRDAVQLRDRIAPTAPMAVELAKALNKMQREALALASPLPLLEEETGS